MTNILGKHAPCQWIKRQIGAQTTHQQPKNDKRLNNSPDNYHKRKIFENPYQSQIRPVSAFSYGVERRTPDWDDDCPLDLHSFLAPLL